MTTDELAENARLISENARLHRMVLEMAERIAAASEVLSKVAEKKKKPPAFCWLANRYLGRRCDDAQKKG